MPAPPSPSVEPGAVRERLLAFVNENIMAPGHPIEPGDRLESHGVDSMALLKILLFIEDAFGFWIPDEDLVADNVASLDVLARYVSRKIAA